MADTWKLDASGNLVLNSSGQVAGCTGDLCSPYRHCSDNTILTSGGGEVVDHGVAPIILYGTISGFGSECFKKDPADARPCTLTDVAATSTGSYTDCGCSTFFFPGTPVRRCSDNSLVTSGGNPVVINGCFTTAPYFQLTGYGSECFYIVPAACRQETGSDVIVSTTGQFTDCTCGTPYFP